MLACQYGFEMRIFYIIFVFLHHFLHIYIIKSYSERGLCLSYMFTSFLHGAHCIKYMTYALEQSTSRKIWSVFAFFYVCWFLKVNVVMTWSQHRILLFPKHGEHFSDFKVLSSSFFIMLFSILLLPMSSLRFLLRSKALTVPFWNFYFRDFLTDSMFQLFRIILLMFGKNRLYVIAYVMRVFVGVSFLLSFISSFLSDFSTVLMRFSNSSELYICSTKFELFAVRFKVFRCCTD